MAANATPFGLAQRSGMKWRVGLKGCRLWAGVCEYECVRVHDRPQSRHSHVFFFLLILTLLSTSLLELVSACCTLVRLPVMFFFPMSVFLFLFVKLMSFVCTRRAAKYGDSTTQGSYTERQSLEFDLSHFQVWICKLQPKKEITEVVPKDNPTFLKFSFLGKMHFQVTFS